MKKKDTLALDNNNNNNISTCTHARTYLNNMLFTQWFRHPVGVCVCVLPDFATRWLPNKSVRKWVLLLLVDAPRNINSNVSSFPIHIINKTMCSEKYLTWCMINYHPISSDAFSFACFFVFGGRRTTVAFAWQHCTRWIRCISFSSIDRKESRNEMIVVFPFYIAWYSTKGVNTSFDGEKGTQMIGRALKIVELVKLNGVSEIKCKTGIGIHLCDWIWNIRMSRSMWHYEATTQTH